MRTAHIFWAITLAASTQASGQSTSVVDAAHRSNAAPAKAVRTFDDDALPQIKGRLSNGAVELPTAAAPAESAKAADDNSTPASDASNPPAQMKPEEMKELLAHRTSLENTLKQIQDEIQKSDDTARRDALELMRSNVQANLAEVNRTIESAEKPANPKPAANPKKSPSTPPSPSTP